jgi:hypothetical protein
MLRFSMRQPRLSSETLRSRAKCFLGFELAMSDREKMRQTFYDNRDRLRADRLEQKPQQS